MRNLFFATFLLFFTSCATSECDENIACTEVFVTIEIKLENQQGKPYGIDSYKTINKSTKESFRLGDVNGLRFGTYRVFDDSKKDKTSNKGEIFIFEGLKDGNIVVSEEFVISKDCCHINLVSGKTKVVI